MTIESATALPVSTVRFHDQELLALRDDDGNVFVAMKPIVEGMGLSWPRQFRKLQENKTKFKHCHMATVAEDGKNREVVCIPLPKLNAWLFSVNPEKVRKDIRPNVIRYQEECAFVLYEYWHKGEAVNPRFANATPDAPRELPRLTTAEERKHLATTRAKIMGALGPSTPGYQRFSRTINKALGINHIRELTIDRLPGVEALFDMMWLFVQAGSPEDQPKRAAFILERLEPCGDTHKDAIEEIVESLRRGWETYTKFVSNAEADMHKIVRAIVADMENCDMTAMEKYHLRSMADEIARAINEQGHLQHIAGNAMRPIMRTMIHMTDTVSTRRKSRPGSVSALPAGRGRSRKQAALPR